MQPTQSAFTRVNIYKESTNIFTTIFYPFDSSKVVTQGTQRMIQHVKHVDLSNDSSNSTNKLLQAKRASVERDAAQQGFLILVLACNGFEVKVNKLYKKGRTTHQLYVIESITREGKVYFNLDTLHFPSENLKQKRRRQDTATNNAMIDIIEKFCGAQFVMKIGKKLSLSIPMKRIHTVSIDGINFNSEKIMERGIYQNESIRDNLTPEGCTINSNQVGSAL
ncbi:hypothetical protein EIN_307300 [Entamoeba invadens IP1]|uniref:Uncharacterized protein n=1 Tax=Entamoeba invadens IP1 TaxID=370355 RepID=A0A0A1TYZ8_ENTIV|nr:hypothetical protein EIN_307300 [Entamoeba invadens IP1]ELP86734.1 hypothetical protein EIN_307300 [Entamoeba invadens IP1]|eukprot:XP_004186080.1 hypothetical protein EIN_307300 [Entamoeba invadens IP1]